ncbi:MAG: hypothetical protein ACD_12C00034G0003 [uncultured bacterium]|nr:MAG: hypothetical protein ACD_12C00034G0003 [uncultured bacterium]
MQEPSAEPLGPKIINKDVQVLYPYQEQKEQHIGKKFEKLIVFGQGPVKPVLIENELTENQKNEWQDFKNDPLHNKEPSFRVIEGSTSTYLSQLKDIDEMRNISDDEKKQLKEFKRQEWQQLGRFALNRWGRQNALAAGLSLYLGITDKVILSGGQTIQDWVKSTLPPERLEHWPSEAKLMKDIIVRRFGKMYLEKYGKPIESVLDIEDGSTNTLLNFANSIVKEPSLISPKSSIGLLATDFHMNRCQILAELFTVSNEPNFNIKAQNMLEQRVVIRNKLNYQEMQKWLTDIEDNPDLKLDRIPGEKRWTKGLVDPEFTSYFMNYFSQFNTPETIPILQNAINLFKDPKRIEFVRQNFKSVGLNFDEFGEEDLLKLSTENPAKFSQLIEGLKKIPRTMPPEEK